ncbi:PREDICTED: interleukin-17 receptor C [Dipodomys ordii]|uniref:Interleukin-17 receptor C n=1 Tax=Dipodomys ordii TaxID=10020 RepID=A0A1S3EPE0_DIPOR|nr:PREDICTED: interleukin-17 receptor C [Dipodomys ordii]
MPVPWLLLSLALGGSPGVVSLERLVGSQDAARCSQGLSCHLWDGDVLCLPGGITRAPGPVLVPTHLRTELVLRCHRETDCDLCVRVAVDLAVRGHWQEPEDEEESGRALGVEQGDAGNAPLQAQVVLSFQSYPTTRCVLLEVRVPAALAQAGQSVGSVVFDCFEAALGAEVRIWSYTQPRYQKELNLTQQLPDCRGLQVRDSIQNCRALPWLNVSADGDDVRLVLDVSEEQRFGLLLYWSQVQGTSKPLWHRNLTGPQNITLSHTDLVPCLCIQVWPLEPDSVRTGFCPFRQDPRAHRNLWRAARLRLLPPRSWKLEAPCSLQAEVVLCWQAPGPGPCQPLVPPVPPENVTVNKVRELPLLKDHPNICVQVSNWEKLQLQECPWADSLGPLKDDVLLVETRGPQDNRSLCALEPHGCTPLPSRASTRAARLGEQLLQDLHSGQCLQLWADDLGALWACPMDKYIHRRWALVWLACLLIAAVLFLFFLLKKDRMKPAATRGRAALLLHSADSAGFERACAGDGTRGGSGHCDCQAGYAGEACGQCGLGYFEAERNASHLVCSACFGPCARCSGPEESNCLQCKKGWALHHLKCIDIDECGTERASCGVDQFCVNTEGSYECRDCAKACLGCMGAGPGRCKKCSPGYQQVGSKCLDVDECEAAVCPGENEKCENVEGGYRCTCAEGFEQLEGACVKEEVPVTQGQQLPGGVVSLARWAAGRPESAGFFSEMTEDELVVLQQMFFGVIICALATLAAKGDLVFTAIFIGAVAAMTGYWLSERSDRVLEGFIKGCPTGRRLLVDTRDSLVSESGVSTPSLPALRSSADNLVLGSCGSRVKNGRELSAQGALAWFHAQRRQTLQEGGVVVLLFSPGAVALCREWLQDGAVAPGARGPHDAFAASLNCVLPDFLQGQAPGRYVVACFDGLLHPDAVPTLFRAVPVFSLPSQLPEFLGSLQGPGASRPRRLAERAEQVSRALQPALDSCFLSPGAPGRETGPE